ncbi:MAG: hypothetical protein JKY81_07435 [Colwellia sp.]|nr:hypothetical protein [Colwellia sp.]
MRRTQQQWLTLFQTQNNSGLSIKDFCLEQRISTSSFYKHKAILNNSSVALEPSPFSQVQLMEPDTIETAPHVIVLKVGKVNMTLDGQTSSHWLANLVEQLA